MCVDNAFSLVRPDPLVQSVTRLTVYVEVDHEIISTIILLLSADSRRVVVSYKRKYGTVHEVLVNHLVKRAQEKVWLSELTVEA